MQSYFYGLEYYGLSFGNDNTGFAVGRYGLIMKTTNKGINWNYVSSGTYLSLYSTFFIDSMRGYVSGVSVFLKTTNAGNLWTPCYVPHQRIFESLYFINLDTGFSVVSTEIWKTTDGGNNWGINQILGNTLYSIYFINSTTGFISAGNIIYKTTDAGMSWFEANHLSNGIRGYEFEFTNENTGYLCGYNVNTGLIYKTTNSGNNWDIIFESSNNYEIRSLSFPTNLFGYATGVNGVLKTTNAGLNWSPVLSTGTYNSIHFVNNNTGYLSGYNGLLLKTTNGGQNWLLQNSGTNETLYDIIFLNENTGFTLGFGGKIIKTTNGGTTIGINQTNEEMPDEFLLYQNYPNPFNQSTMFKFQCSIAGMVEIKVFDLLGREVRTLVNEYKQAGTYEVRFNAGDLPSGIYFYRMQTRMQTEKYTETKKLILLK